MLGCVRPNSDFDLPVHSVFPEDVTGMEELCRELEEQERYEAASTPSHARDKESLCNRVDETALLELDDSGIEQGYCGIDFGTESAMNLPRQNLSTASDDLGFDGTASADMNGNTPFPDTALSPFTWSMPDTQRSDLTMCFLQKAGTLQSMDVLNQGLVEYEFDAMEPNILSYNSEARHGGTHIVL
ncbi:Fluconazole resistance protein 1 [Ilyonectria robusta]